MENLNEHSINWLLVCLKFWRQVYSDNLTSAAFWIDPICVAIRKIRVIHARCCFLEKITSPWCFFANLTKCFSILVVDNYLFMFTIKFSLSLTFVAWWCWCYSQNSHWFQRCCCLRANRTSLWTQLSLLAAGLTGDCFCFGWPSGLWVQITGTIVHK